MLLRFYFYCVPVILALSTNPCAVVDAAFTIRSAVECESCRPRMPSERVSSPRFRGCYFRSQRRRGRQMCSLSMDPVEPPLKPPLKPLEKGDTNITAGSPGRPSSVPYTNTGNTGSTASRTITTTDAANKSAPVAPILFQQRQTPSSWWEATKRWWRTGSHLRHRMIRNDNHTNTNHSTTTTPFASVPSTNEMAMDAATVPTPLPTTPIPSNAYLQNEMSQSVLSQRLPLSVASGAATELSSRSKNSTTRSLIEAWSTTSKQHLPLPSSSTPRLRPVSDATWKRTDASLTPMSSLRFVPTTEPLVTSSLIQPHDVITLADLQAILLENGFIRRVELAQQRLSPSTYDSLTESAASRLLAPNQKGPVRGANGREGVAFPQPTALSYPCLLWSTTIAGSGGGMVLLASVWPSLWLMGALVGSILGYDTVQSRHSPLVAKSVMEEPNVVQKLLLACGRRLAILYLKVVDTLQAFFFMYKTGQLSYEYYKRYAALDQRFDLQQKMDAWNARFVQGKLAFDQWERQNEVGRKLLAGLRTAWLVEERSQSKKRRLWLLKRNQTRQSRYRVVQLLYDSMFTLGTMWQSLKQAIVGNNVPGDLMRGVWRRSMGDRRWGQVRSSVTAMASVCCLGTGWTRSPIAVAVLVAIMALLWPTWLADTWYKFDAAMVETRVLGRGESETYDGKQQQRDAAGADVRYHFFRTLDGRKRYYRAGQPWYGSFLRPSPKEKSKFGWPWRST